MKTFLRLPLVAVRATTRSGLVRRLAGIAALGAVIVAPPEALSAPPTSVAITSPANGTNLGVITSPAGSVTITATATPSGGSNFITQVDFRVNGVSVGVSTGGAPFSATWTPTAPGTYTLTAVATDSSAASNNSLTSAPVTVAVSAVRTASIISPAANSAIAQNSQVFLRSTAAMSDGVVSKVEFVLDPGTANTVVGTATQAPYNVSYTVTASVGAHTLLARATASDGITTFDSPPIPFSVVSAVGARPSVTLTAPAAGTFIATSTATTLTATATDTDGFIPNTAGGGVTFFADGDPIGTDLTAPYSLSWTPPVAKTYSLVAQAIDDRENVGQSVAVTVTAVAALPTITVTAPSTAVTGSATSITATATAGAGATVAQVAFFANGIAIGSPVTTPPYSVLWIPTSVGANSITARVTDSAGVTANSATSIVTVSTPAGTAVTLHSPANDATISQGSQIFLRSSASIAGNIVSRVDYYFDGVLIPGGSVSTAPYNLAYTVTAPAGAHTVFARAVASDGTTTVDSPTATINVAAAVGTPPTVTLTAPASGTFVATGTAVALTATASDSDGFIPTTTGGGVTFYVDGDPIATDLTAPYSTNWTPGPAKRYTLRAQTIDDKANIVLSAPVTVTAVAGLPTVSLTSPPTSAAVGSAVTLAANATPGPGATVTQVAFFDNGAAIGAPVTTEPYTVSWTPTSAGAHILTAQVTDSNSVVVTSSPATVTVGTVAAPTVSITAPANGALLTVGSSVAVSATATAGTGATITQVQFLEGATIIGTDTSAPYSVNWTPTSARNYSLTARVTDSAGNSTTSAPVTVTAAAGGEASVSITAPTVGSVLTVGTPVTVNATAAGALGATVAQVQFLAGTTIIGTDTSAPYSVTWTPGSAGNFNLTARVTDSAGNTATSTAVPVTALALPTTAITSPANNSSVPVGTDVRIAASASPSAGATVSQVEFFAGDVSLGAPDTVSPYELTWRPTTTGTVVLTSRVTDSAGYTNTSAPVNLNVGSAVTIVGPGPGSSIMAGSTVPITATAIPNAGATITQVQFLANGNAIGNPDFAPPYTIDWTPTTAGTYTLTARSTDSTGDSATSTPVVVVVVPVAASGVALSMAPSSTTVIAGAPRYLTATVASTIAVEEVQFLYDGTLVGTTRFAPYTLLFNVPYTPGRHNLEAVVVDRTGQTFRSNFITIDVVSGIGSPPAAGILAPNAGAFVAAGVVTPIRVTASDTDGAIASVQIFVNGVVLSGTPILVDGVWTQNWNPPSPGLYSIAAIVTDNEGNSSAAPPVGVNVTDSSSPVISLTLSPRTAGGGGAASTTLPSGAIRNIVADVNPASGRAVVRVEFFVDGTKVGEDTREPYTFRYVAPELPEGEQRHTYVFTARATDNAGAARDVHQTFTVITRIGEPPVVSLLTPPDGYTTVPGSAVSLAATAVANGGTVASVQFYANGSPTGISGGNAVTNPPYTSSFTPTAPGTYVIDAIATDDRGNTTISNAATITVAYATPTIVVTSPNPNATARATPLVPLTLSATATAGQGSSVLLVEFMLDGVQIAADTTAPYSMSWIPTVAHLGSHVLTARVTDTNAQTATSNPININVANVVGSPPTVSVSAQPIPAGFGLQTASTVNFVANAVATGTGSTLTGVEIFLNDVSIGMAAREQSTNLYRLAYDLSRFDFTLVPPIINETTGAVTYPVRLYAIARDSNGNQTVSSTTNLTINPATSSAPTIQLQALSPTNITAGTQFFVLPNFNDTDGTVTTIQLYANAVLVGTVGSPQLGQTLTYTPSAAGRFNLFAVATDDSGNTAVSTPAIVVNVAAVTPPTTSITQPADDSTVTTVGAPIFMEGTAVNNATTQIPTLQFIATASGGARNIITGSRVGTTNVYRAIWTPNTADTYTVTTQATVGSVSATSTSSRKVVVNNVVGLAPNVSISVPGSATTASTANFTATATDSDGSIVGVEFFLNRNSIGQAVKDPQGNTWRITATFAGLSLGGNEVVARATDSSGNVSASPTSSVNVTAASSIAPSITITPSDTNPAFNRRVELRASARDTDGTVNTVQYFANSTAIGSSTNAGTNYQVNWTPSASGTYYVWAVATDNTSITTVAPMIEIVVRRNNPVLENSAFILQTYQDIANTTSINPLIFDDLDTQLGAGTITRADLVNTLTVEPGFSAPVNLLAAYWVLMGQWPTPQNYTTLLTNTRNNGLSSAVGNILSSNEYVAKWGVAPTITLLNNPASTLPADVFITRLWQGAGLGTPSALNNTQFRSNNVLTATLGRGYGPVGLSSAVAEFITNTNATNTALWNRARAAALFYQLVRPPITMTVDEITAKVATLTAMPDIKSMADAVVKDVLYTYRYVTITKNPTSLVVSPRSGALFSVDALGQPPLAYQWLLNGAPIPGATNPLLSLTNVDASRVGTYTAVVTSAVASATSDPATLTLSTTPSKLANISTRGVTRGGADVLIAGFIVAGNATQTRQVLIRVVGPRLGAAPFNVSGFLADPELEVYRGSVQTPMLTNDDWGTQTGGAAAVTALRQAFTRAGAFALDNNSRDAAILATLPPGPYTVLARGPSATASGVVLIEVYDLTTGGPAASKTENVSTRGFVGTGSDVLIAGFVVNGPAARRMLIRGVGPTLSQFGLASGSLLANPQLRVIDQESGETVATNDDWASGDDAGIIAAAARTANAFPLANGSRDAAVIVMLPPGAYTAQLSGVGNTTGIGIVEVYDVDP